MSSFVIPKLPAVGFGPAHHRFWTANDFITTPINGIEVNVAEHGVTLTSDSGVANLKFKNYWSNSRNGYIPAIDCRLLNETVVGLLESTTSSSSSDFLTVDEIIPLIPRYKIIVDNENHYLGVAKGRYIVYMKKVNGQAMINRFELITALKKAEARITKVGKL